MSLLADLIATRIAARDERRIARRAAALLNGATGLLDAIEDWTADRPDLPAILAGDARIDRAGLVGAVNRWARWAILHGVATGDPVALLASDRPDRAAAWIGLAAAGAVPVLIDERFAGEDLARVLDRTAPRLVVVDATRLAQFETAARHLVRPVAVWVDGPHAMAYLRVDEALAELSPARLQRADRRSPGTSAEALRLIAAGPDGPIVGRIGHRRLLDHVAARAAALAPRRDDRLAVAAGPQPHLGSVLAPLVALAAGLPLVIADRADPAAFLADLARHRATVLHWDDDLCRRLLAAPPHPDDRRGLRCVEGLPPPAAEAAAFVARFAVGHCIGWFAAPDGSLRFDLAARPGSVARLGPNADLRLLADGPGDDGRPRLARPGEPGEAIVAVVADADLDPETEPELVRDLARPGDRWRRTGLRLRRDRDGRHYRAEPMADARPTPDA